MNIKGKKILFRLINSAWISNKREVPSSLRLPVNNYPKDVASEYDCVITCMHHPYNWFHPDNCAEVLDYLRRTSDLLILGHEHRKDTVNMELNGDNLLEFRGKELFGDGSTFAVYHLFKEPNIIQVREYVWSEDRSMYITQSVNKEIITRASSNSDICLVPNEKFKEYLSDIEMAITHFSVEKVKLEEIYCWPTLDVLDISMDNEYTKRKGIVSADIPEIVLKHRLSFIAGASLTGKTAMAKMLCSDYLKQGKSCVLCDINDITSTKTENILLSLEERFIEEYSSDYLEHFRQSSPKDRILILDNVTISVDDNKFLRDVLDATLGKYYTVIVFLDSHLLLPTVLPYLSVTDYVAYNINYFGNRKRREFICKWFALGGIIEDDSVEKACTVINQLLGKQNNYIPATPIFLIGVLQNLKNSGSTHFSGSQYGYIYESLINANLAVLKDSYGIDCSVNVYSSILSWIAFLTLKDNIVKLDYEYIRKSVTIFCDNKGLDINTESFLCDMVKARIFALIEPEVYEFSYPYMSYYFAGRYIAYNYQNIEVREQVGIMCEKLYLKRYSNVIIFACHFANNTDIIHNVLSIANKTLTGCDTFEFENWGELYTKEDENITQTLIPDKIGTNEDVNTNIDKSLALRDELGYQDGTVSSIDNDEDAILSDLTIALRTAEVLSQILRNYPGDIDFDLKKQIINKVYGLHMKVVQLLISTVQENHELFIEYIKELLTRNTNKSSVETSIRANNLLISITAGMICGTLCGIAKAFDSKLLLRAIGTTLNEDITIAKELILQELKFNVLKTPNFTEAINLYKRLCKENVFAAIVLKASVARYLQFNQCKYSIRSSLCSNFNLNLKKGFIESKRIEKQQMW